LAHHVVIIVIVCQMVYMALHMNLVDRLLVQFWCSHFSRVALAVCRAVLFSGEDRIWAFTHS